METQLKEGTDSSWEQFNSTRAIALGCSGGSVLSSFVGFMFLLASQTMGFQATLINKGLFFLPHFITSGAIISLCIIYFIIRTKKPFSQAIQKPWLLTSDIISLLVIALIILSLNLILTSVDYEVLFETGILRIYNSILVIMNGASIVVSLILLVITSEITDKDLAQKKPVSHVEEVMGYKTLLGRAFLYCGKTYGMSIILFLALGLLGKILGLIIFSPLSSWVVGEEAFLLKYLKETNFVQGMVLDPDIANRVRIWYYSGLIVSPLQDGFFSSFYFMAMAISIRIIVKSYRGSDPTISSMLKQLKPRIGHVIGVSFILGFLYRGGLAVLLVPGVIVYMYCILVLPNAAVLGKWKMMQNFGKSRELVKGNGSRMLIYTLLILGISYLVSLPLTSVNTAIRESLTTVNDMRDWLINPFQNLGQLIFFETINATLSIVFGPLEASIVAMIFIDFTARKKVKRSMTTDTSTKGRAKAKADLPLDQRIQRARYCPKCGLSVRRSLNRCPNCKTEL